ncbi:MAG TPA: hypothetical protein DDY13_07395 [Cytophagales bacterium]|jgi:hypothetical protein|nr:hypothetical protein [Cytophagales bacterium]
MKYLATLLVVIIFSSGNQAQNNNDTTYWKIDLSTGLNINQASFSSNWTAGGINSIGLNTHFNLKANYQKGRHSWDNQIELLYGFVNNQGQGFRKTNDRIFIDTKYGYQLSDHWSLYASLNFLTQFADGFRYEDDTNGNEQEILISRFFAPAFITTSYGFQYQPKDFFKVRLSPFSPRFTIVSDTKLIQNIPENYGVARGETLRTEWAAFQLFADFDRDLAKNLNLKWKYILFWNYELPVDEIDHRLDVTLSAQINSFLSTDLGVIMIYDVDQDADIQLSQLFSLGLVYKFKNFEEEE